MTNDTTGALEARDRLTQALNDLDARGGTTPCRGDDRWISERAEERRQVASLCQACPIQQQCYAAGVFEEHGIWGGTDRTKSTTRRRKTA